MIISRTPFRISFFGGGTDYPPWYLKNSGSVLSATIDKYCYITLRYLPPFFEHRIRIVYSKIELCQKYDEIQHPAVRETLRFLKLERGLEIHHDGDLPARSGMGSSSSFTVGLLNALYAKQGIMASKKQLALESIHIEQNMIKETVGSQDQIATTYGGINQIVFHKSGEFEVHPMILTRERVRELNAHLMLFYTGIKRTASNVADSYVNNIQEKEKLLNKMKEMVEKGIRILQNGNMCEFGKLLHEAWMAKRSLSSKVSNNIVDELYRRALNYGALGGKITGAGGGGFLLLFVPPSRRHQVREALSELLHVPFRFEFQGSHITFYDPPAQDYKDVEKDRAGRCLCASRELNAIVS
jgi:D-glycero-alpha-D-manno-heptose-7-phosphate kinase